MTEKVKTGGRVSEGLGGVRERRADGVRRFSVRKATSPRHTDEVDVPKVGRAQYINALSDAHAQVVSVYARSTTTSNFGPAHDASCSFLSLQTAAVFL